MSARHSSISKHNQFSLIMCCYSCWYDSFYSLGQKSGHFFLRNWSQEKFLLKLSDLLTVIGWCQKVITIVNLPFIAQSMSHCFFTILNIKRKGNFQFCFPSLLGIHRNWKIVKMALLNPCKKLNFFLAKRLLLMHYEIPKNIHNMSHGPPNPGFRSSKVQTEDFLKKYYNISKILSNLGFLASLESKIRRCLFFWYSWL